MPEVRLRRQLPKLDMNPMVDMAFLLVSFFMLTTTFKTAEPVSVNLPFSQMEVKIPEKDLATIMVTKEGEIYFSITGKYARSKLLNMISARYELNLTDEEIAAFTLMTGMGMPVNQLKGFLQLTPEERKQVDQPGIPYDSLNNELQDWIVYARVTNPKIRMALKGDKDVPYPVIKNVINTLLKNNITRFNLITELEKESDGSES